MADVRGAATWYEAWGTLCELKMVRSGTAYRLSYFDVAHTTQQTWRQWSVDRVANVRWDSALHTGHRRSALRPASSTLCQPHL